MQVIHITGEAHYDEEVHQLAAERGIKAGRGGYYPFPFLGIDELKNAYAAADLVISRAGANSIAEIAANKKPAILIPIEGSANNHQRMNAYELAKVGGAFVLEEKNLGEHTLMEAIQKVMGNENLRNSMTQKIQAFYHPQASEHIAQGIVELGS